MGELELEEEGGHERSARREVAARIVERLLHDLVGRKGLGDEYDACDVYVQREIRDRWEEIVERGLG